MGSGNLLIPNSQNEPSLSHAIIPPNKKRRKTTKVKCIQIDHYGGLAAMTHRELPTPTPKADEVLVRVRCAGINFMDIHTCEGKYANSQTYKVSLPCTLGMEGAGEVVALGADVKDLAVGDRVAWCIVWGSYAEYAAVPAWRCVKLPDALSFEMAAASLFHGLTAHYLAHDVGALAHADTEQERQQCGDGQRRGHGRNPLSSSSTA